MKGFDFVGFGYVPDEKVAIFGYDGKSILAILGMVQTHISQRVPTFDNFGV